MSRPRVGWKKVQRAALALLFLLLPPLTAELYYRSLTPQSEVLILTLAAQAPTTSELLELTPREGDRVMHAFDRGRPARITLRRNGPGQFAPHPILSKTLRADVATRFVKRDQSGTVFDATYSSDDEGRRVSLNRGSGDILFFGGSFCFGSGVDDDQTLPEQTAALLDATAVNYGVGGYGPHHVLYQLEQLPVTSSHGRDRHIVYVFIPDHVRRAHGSFSSFRWNQGRVPHYRTSQEGQPRFAGSWREAHPWRARLYSLLQHSRLVDRIGLDIPTTIGDIELAAVTALIEQCAKVARTRWAAEFTVFVYRDSHETSNLGSRMTASLQERGVHVVVGPEALPELVITRDGHPSPEGHREAAELLGRALAQRLDSSKATSTLTAPKPPTQALRNTDSAPSP